MPDTTRRARRVLVCAAALLLYPCGSHAADQPRPARPAAASPAPAPPASTPAPAAAAREPEARDQLAVKWVRDSAEYEALARMVYAFAARAVAQSLAAEPARAGVPAVVVLDVDETALDNSTYQLERAAYGLAFAPDSWTAWIRRRAAGVVPGVLEFVRAVRPLGVRVVWLSNRETSHADDTQANLAAHGLWDAGDRLCLRASREDSKRARRTSLRSGQGACTFEAPARVLAYLGDQMGDFPEDGEEGEGVTRADLVGHRSFVLPDPMYGEWTRAVTRSLP